MTADEIIRQQDQLEEEREGIELVRRRYAQIQALQLQIKQLVAARKGRGSGVLAEELSLAVFRLYEAKSVLAELMATLRRMKAKRERTTASALPYDARTAQKHSSPLSA
jgi:hypothetical protein